MKAALLASDALRSHVVVMYEGDEAVASLNAFVRKAGVRAGHVTGLGAFSRIVLGWFDPNELTFLRDTVDEQVEAVSFIGDIALDEGDVPVVHAHCVVVTRDGVARGGHVLEAAVRPTLEVMVYELPAALQRHRDPRSGLALLRLDAQS
jgi:uncharacterized protein